MARTDLPVEFLNEMEKLLGEEYPAFLASYEMPRRNGLRLNRRRISPARFEENAPFEVERIPWTDNGYYVDYRDMPARHPWYQAGVYYLQEPSAMAPAQILPVMPGDRVLDLCAAPGGKATELGAKLYSRLADEPAAASAAQNPGQSGAPAAEPAARDSGQSGTPDAASAAQGEMCPDAGIQSAGLLVANEISATRLRALLHNIEAFGIPNALVTNETPARLAARFPEYFDKVLVDAPCSGEGMFRKDADVAKAWYPEKVSECAAIQREIILEAADMLRPGGYMVYSTCTFAPEENELVLLHLLKNRPQMELVPIPLTDGRESFSHAFSLAKLAECGYYHAVSCGEGPEADPTGVGLPKGDPAGADQTGVSLPKGDSTGADQTEAGLPEADLTGVDLTGAIRIWPHKAGGEGHFTALLRKRSAEGSSEPEKQNFDRAVQPADIPQGEGMQTSLYGEGMQTGLYGEGMQPEVYSPGARPESGKGTAYVANRAREESPGLDIRAGRSRKESGKNRRSGKENRGRGAHGAARGQTRPSGSLSTDAYGYLQEFLVRFLPEADIDRSLLEDHNGHLYLSPAETAGIRGLTFLRNGLYLGELKKNRFEPAQELALALPAGEQGEERISFSAGDARTAQYLHGETVRIEEEKPNGWYLVCVDGYPLGWGKLTGNVLKNKLPAGWRT